MKSCARLATAILVVLACLAAPAAADEGDAAAGSVASFYTLVAGDQQPTMLLEHMGITGPDAFREVLLWNPEVHNIYALTPGTRLRVPGSGPRPAFPAFETDYSKWKIIGSHTSRFVGSPSERVTGP